MNTYYKKSRSKTPDAERNDAQPIQGNINREDIGNQATLKMMEAAKRFDANHGTELNMPEELKARMENHFGMSLSGIKLRESSQVRDMGTTAVARGDTVSFAPGVYNPDTRIGRELIGHEIAHIVQQSSGKAEANLPGADISLDQGLEHAADHEGSMAVMDTGSVMETAQPIMPLVALAPEGAPMQGKNWLRSLWGYITGKDKKEEIRTRDRAVTMISGRPPILETAEDKAPSSPETEMKEPTPLPQLLSDTETEAPPPIPEAEPDIAPPPPPPESELDIPPPPPPESELDIPPPPLPESELDIPPPPIPEAEAESTTTTTTAAPEQAAETTDASGSASSRSVSSVGLPTGGKVWKDAGQYIKSRDREFANIIDLLNSFHHTIDTVRLPAVPAQDADKTSFLQRIGEANTIVMNTYNEALDALLKYSTAHSNDKDRNKSTLATYAVQYYMIGDAEKIRTQSIYDAMQRAVSSESPTGGQADFNELAGKTYREAISSMGVFVSRAKPIKQMSGGINTVDFVSTGENRVGVLKRGQRELFLSETESGLIQSMLFGPLKNELGKIKARSFESLVEEYGFEGARVLVKYRDMSREQIMKAAQSMSTSEDVYRGRLGKETNYSDQGNYASAHEVIDANTSQRDVAVSRINKLLGFDIITETEFAQTEDRTKSSVGKKAVGEQAGNFVYYVGAGNAGAAGVLATLQAISEYCKARASISENSALGEEEKERALASTSINTSSAQAIDLGRAGNALQMIKLSVIDMIVGHVDRHVGNYMVQPGEDGIMTMRGIDNDTAFGLFDDISGDSEERKKVDKSRLTPFLSDTLPFVPRSIYESVNRVDSSMIRGALAGLLSDEEILFTESRFDKVKAHMEQLASQNKIKEPNEQDVAELARPKDSRYARTNYMSELLYGQGEIERSLSKDIDGVFKNSGFANVEEMKQAVQSLQVNGIDPIELVRTKKAFTKDIVRDALSARQRSATI